MKTTSTPAWFVALAVMSMRRPCTKAEAAPAPLSDQETEQPKIYLPRHVKRQYRNITETEPVSIYPDAHSASSSSSSSPSSSSRQSSNPAFNPFAQSAATPPYNPPLPSSDPRYVYSSAGDDLPRPITTSASTSQDITPGSSSTSYTPGLATQQTAPKTSTNSWSSNQEAPHRETWIYGSPSHSIPSYSSSTSESDSSLNGGIPGAVPSTGYNGPETVAPTASSSHPSAGFPSTTSGSSTLPPPWTWSYVPTSVFPPLRPSGQSASSSASSSASFDPLRPSEPPAPLPHPPSPPLSSGSFPGQYYPFNPNPPAGTGNVGSGTGNAYVPNVPPTPAPNPSSNTTTSASSSTAPIIVGVNTIIDEGATFASVPSSTTEPASKAPAQNPGPSATGNWSPVETTTEPLATITGVLPTNPEPSGGARPTASTTSSTPAGLIPGIFPSGTNTYGTASGAGTLPSTTSVTSQSPSTTSPAPSSASNTEEGPNPYGGAGITSAISGIATSSSTSSVSATVTDAAISSSLASESSGIPSDTTSALTAQTTGVTSVSPTVTDSSATVTGTDTSSGSYSLSTSTSASDATFTGTDTSSDSYSLSTSTSASDATFTGTGTSSGSDSLSTSTSSSDDTFIIATGTTTDSVSQTDSATSTGTLTETSTSAPTGYESTISSYLPVTTGTQVTLTSTIQSSNVSIVSETSSGTTTASPTSATTSLTFAPTTTETPSSVSATWTVSETTTSKGPETIVPTGTDTATVYTIPSSLQYAPTTTSAPPAPSTGSSMPLDSTTSSAPQGIPTAMPRIIQPPGGFPAAPANSTLIQVGFNYGLNFPFVCSTDNSANQIFAYLPQGIAYALEISQDKVRMHALMPYDTTKTLNYITTLAQAYIPEDLVDTLQLDLHTTVSRAYTNPHDAVRTLMSMINPTIPIVPGANMDDGTHASSSNHNNPAATESGPGAAGAPIGGDSGRSQKVKGTSVGIGVGAVCGAAVYAAAMVYVARRYRKKRQSHRRASSVPTAGEMSQRSPGTSGTLSGGGMGSYFMSGANGRRESGSGSHSGRSSGRVGRGSRNSAGSSNGRSVRDAGISNPIMAENSLGWN